MYEYTAVSNDPDWIFLYKASSVQRRNSQNTTTCLDIMLQKTQSTTTITTCTP